MYSYELKIPKERIAVLIGKKGRVKKRLAEKLDIRLTIDSDEGLVILKGEDSFNLLIAQNIIKAIGRGFNPSIAELLLDEDYGLEIIDIGEYSGKNKNKLFRLRARCIGSDGKARKTIEQLTDTYISIYGKSVGIIGGFDNVLLAKRAIEALLKGSKHGNVYAMISRLKENL